MRSSIPSILNSLTNKPSTSNSPTKEHYYINFNNISNINKKDETCTTIHDSREVLSVNDSSGNFLGKVQFKIIVDDNRELIKAINAYLFPNFPNLSYLWKLYHYLRVYYFFYLRVHLYILLLLRVHLHLLLLLFFRKKTVAY